MWIACGSAGLASWYHGVQVGLQLLIASKLNAVQAIQALQIHFK